VDANCSSRLLAKRTACRRMAVVQKNLGQALHWIRLSAEHGNPVGQCNLGSLYLSGRGVPKNPSGAARWYLAAAEQGFSQAQNNLALMYFKGTGIPRDYAQAAIWARRAAEGVNVLGQAFLAYLYEHGLGVPLDYVAAYMWYSAAAAGGNARSSKRLKDLSRVMLAQQLVTARTQASAWVAEHLKAWNTPSETDSVAITEPVQR
jgi:uncharacterized protein